MTSARIKARTLARLSRSDAIALFVVGMLAMATIMAGRRAALTLRPASAVESSEMLDSLDVPARLPNASTLDFGEQHQLLYERISTRQAIVSFYAPWCGPCQEELPELVREVGDAAQIFVVVSKDEDLEHTRRQLANLELEGPVALIDETGELLREGRVTALPTTFVINRLGMVRLRTKGFRPEDLWRIKRLVRADRSSW